MNAAIDIRVLRPGDDLGPAAVLLQRFFAEEGFATPNERITAHLAQLVGLDICAALLACREGEPVGVATVSFDFGIEFGWAAEIGDLYVVPEARGLGLARRLVGAAAAFARKRGASLLYVTVTPHGEDAGLMAFYRRLGFADDGRRILARPLGTTA